MKVSIAIRIFIDGLTPGYFVSSLQVLLFFFYLTLLYFISFNLRVYFICIFHDLFYTSAR